MPGKGAIQIQKSGHNVKKKTAKKISGVKSHRVSLDQIKGKTTR